MNISLMGLLGAGLALLAKLSIMEAERKPLPHRWTGTRLVDQDMVPIVDDGDDTPGFVMVPENDYEGSVAHRVYAGVPGRIRAAVRRVWTGAKHLASWAMDRPIIRHARVKAGRRSRPWEVAPIAELWGMHRDADTCGRHSVWYINAGRTAEALLAA
jgi:hypothetical protein